MKNGQPKKNAAAQTDAYEIADERLAEVSGGETGMDIVDRVIRGDYGNGREREDRLRAAGYDYGKVEKMVKERPGYGDRHFPPFND